MLLEDDEGRERPLLPSLTELTLVDTFQDDLCCVPLCDALRKRVEQGVPLEVVDLRMCPRRCFVSDLTAEIREISEIVAQVLDPEASQHMRSLWKRVFLGVFLNYSGREYSETDSDSDTEEEYEEEEYEEEEYEGEYEEEEYEEE